MKPAGSLPTLDEPEITEKKDESEEVSASLLGMEMGLSEVLFNYDEELEAAVIDNLNAINKIQENDVATATPVTEHADHEEGG